MKLISLSLLGYRQFLQKSEIEFPQGLTGICGPNGVGKSKLIEAIGFALYGPRSQILPPGDKLEYISSMAAANPRTEVILTIEVKGERYVITRSLSKAEIRLGGTADALANTPTGVTNFVTGLLRLSAEAFVGTFVARQNEVAKLHTLKEKPRVDLVHRLIGISQLQVAIELSDKDLKELQQEFRQDERQLTETSSEILEKMREYEEALTEALLKENKAELDVKAAEEDLRQKRELLQEVRRKQDLRASKTREVESLQVSRNQSVIHHASVKSEWERAYDARIKHSGAEQELAGLADAETQFAFWESMRARDVILERRSSLDDRLTRELNPNQELLVQLETNEQTLVEEIEQLDQEIASITTQERILADRATKVRETLAPLFEKRGRMISIGAGGTCDNCGMVLQEDSFQVALEVCNQSIHRHETESENLDKEQLALRKPLVGLNEKRRELQDARPNLRARIGALASVRGEIEATKRQINECDTELARFDGKKGTQAFSQAAYENAEKRLSRKNHLTTALGGLAVLANLEDKYRTDLAEVQKWLEQLDAKIEVLKEEIRILHQGESTDKEAEEAFEIAEENHRQARDNELASVKSRTQAETRFDGCREGLKRVRIQEAKLQGLRQKVLIAERTSELLRQMLTEINEEARPRIAELMDTWLHSLIGEKFQGVTLSEDYRVLADGGGGFRGLDHFSGGEQTLLSVMLRIAISLFCQERAGFDTSFLILDEVFGNQDVLHRNQLVRFLLEIQGHYHQILIVNHIEDVTQMFDSIIEVVPLTLNTSKVEKSAYNG